MLTFKEWLLEGGVGVVYSNDVNNANFQKNGARSNREGDQEAALPGPLSLHHKSADEMYLGKDKESDDKEKRRKKQRGLSK